MYSICAKTFLDGLHYGAQLLMTAQEKHREHINNDPPLFAKVLYLFNIAPITEINTGYERNLCIIDNFTIVLNPKGVYNRKILERRYFFYDTRIVS